MIMINGGAQRREVIPECGVWRSRLEDEELGVLSSSGFFVSKKSSLGGALSAECVCVRVRVCVCVCVCLCVRVCVREIPE